MIKIRPGKLVIKYPSSDYQDRDVSVAILRFFVGIITLVLLVLPFLWMKPGEMDLGGDSSRLYFYEPFTFLKRLSLFSVTPFGLGLTEPNHYAIPFIVLLGLVKTVVGSSYVLISLYNGAVLSVAFFSVHLIVSEIVSDRKKIHGLIARLSGMCAGLLYIFMPTMTGNWDKAIFSHTQVFLNPLMFYLLLKFFKTNRKAYLSGVLALTLIFSINFGLTSAPPFFAFYPLALLFLSIYVFGILRCAFHLRNILIGVLFALGLAVFHLVPQAFSLFDPGSFVNTRIFDRNSIYREGVQYFSGVLPYAKVSLKLLLAPLNANMIWFAFLVPTVVVLGYILSRRNNKTFILTGIFFLLTLFLLTAKITNIGVEIYKQLFYLPGFSMFRNFIGQWLFVFSFFYAMLFGQSLAVIFSKFKKPYIPTVVALLMCAVFIFGAWPFILGETVRDFHGLVENQHVPIRMDPKYEQTLEYIRRLPADGKILTFPFTDPYYQLLRGTNGGLYIGPSTISYLTDKRDFSGYAVMTALISEEFLKMVRNRNYEGLINLLRILNIRYIFHNDDPHIYDTDFAGWPYDHVRESMPKNQEDYKTFIGRIGGTLLYRSGSYAIYSTAQDSYDPHIYAAANVKPYSAFDEDGKLLTAFMGENDGIRTAYIHVKDCMGAHTSLCETPSYIGTVPDISFKRINAAKYKITVNNPRGPYVLVFSESFNPSWKLRIVKNNMTSEDVPGISYFGGQVSELAHEDVFWDINIFETLGKKSIPEHQHLFANGYANAWYIKPEDVAGENGYVLILENTKQKVFYISLVFSLCVLVSFIVWSMKKNGDFS